jgi:hypothetical protein
MPGVYILALPPAEAEREHWQVAMEVLISAAEKGGIVMMARIAMLRALNHGDPDPAPAPRRKRAKKSQTALRLISRRKTNHATIVRRYAPRPVTEVTGEFIAL